MDVVSIQAFTYHSQPLLHVAYVLSVSRILKSCDYRLPAVLPWRYQYCMEVMISGNLVYGTRATGGSVTTLRLSDNDSHIFNFPYYLVIGTDS